MTWTPPTSPTPTAAPSTSAPIASWIRRYRVVSGIVGAFVGLMILGGISKAVSSHQSNTQYVPVLQQPSPSRRLTCSSKSSSPKHRPSG